MFERGWSRDRPRGEELIGMGVGNRPVFVGFLGAIAFGVVLASLHPVPAAAQYSATNSAGTAGAACTTSGMYAWPDANGQILKCNGSTWAVTIGTTTGGQWTTSGSNISYSIGSVGLGTTAPAATLDINGGVKVGNNAGSCSSTNNGEIRYTAGNSPPFNYCNGSTWIPFDQTGFVPAYSKLTAASLSVGADYAPCALKSTGVLWCWGYNGYGQVGDGTTTNRTVPTITAAAFAGPWSSVGAGYVSTCAIKSADSSLWCWGNNGFGQLGDATTTTRTTSPVQVSGTWNQVSSGGDAGGSYTAALAATYFTCGVKSDHTGWCWGANGSGNLGDGTTTQRTSPVQVSGTWTSITVGQGYHACGIQTDNSLWCWGYNGYGQLGIGSTTDATTPQQVSGTWSSVIIGNVHTCAIKTNGQLWCWGKNTSGQIGDNSVSTRTSPVQVNGGGTWTKAGQASLSTCAIKNDGTLWCWGYNANNQIPGSAPSGSITVPTAVSLPTLVTGSNWTDISGGIYFFCGRRDDSTVYCWGSNIYAAGGNLNSSNFLPASGS